MEWTEPDRTFILPYVPGTVIIDTISQVNTNHPILLVLRHSFSHPEIFRGEQNSAAAIRGETKRAQQQRDVIMNAGSIQRNQDLHFWIEPGHAQGAEVTPCLKTQSVDARLEGSFPCCQRRNSTVGVGRSSCQLGPAAFAVAEVQCDSQSSCGPAMSRIQYVGAQGTHEPSFCKRNRVILACSPAAISSSFSATLGSRSWSRASISTAVLPVAQTMKIWPNFSSYWRFPRDSAVKTASVVPVSPFCSDADQAAVSLNLARKFSRSPILGCAANASSQSARASPRQIRSAASNRSASLRKGRDVAICSAQRRAPQQRRNVASASTLGPELIRSRSITPL